MIVEVNLKTGEARNALTGEPMTETPPEILERIRSEARARGVPEDAVATVGINVTPDEILRAAVQALRGAQDGTSGPDNQLAPGGPTAANEPDSEDDQTSQEGSTDIMTENKAIKITDDRGNVIADRLPKVDKLKVSVVREGDKLLVPASMDLPTAVAVLIRQIDTEERIVESSTAIDSYPLDLARALTKAVERRYNFVATKNSIGMFGMEIAPPLVGLEINPGAIEQVYWGKIPLPGFTSDEYVEAGCSIKDGIWVGNINARVKGKNKPAVDELITLVRQILHEESVYKGKAFRVVFTPANPRNGFNPDEQPRFMDLTDVGGTHDLIFSEKVMQQLQTSVFNLVEKTDLCKALGIPRKRGVLLEGPYGTGKTLTARVLAKLCEQNGWTFIYLKSVTQLPQAIQFAKIFGRTVIFAEDVDQVFNGDARDEDVNTVLNTMDGIDTKNSEIMVVLTTNNVKDIHKAMLRPGRLDAVINIAAPDAAATERLMRRYGRGLIREHEDLTEAAGLLAGKNAAAVREAVERAKSAAITHLNPGDEVHLTGLDLKIAAEGMLHHLELLREAPADTRTAMQILGDAVGAEIGRIVNEAPGSVTDKTNVRAVVEQVVRDEMAKLAKNGGARAGVMVGSDAE